MPKENNKRTYKTREHWPEFKEQALIECWQEKIGELRGVRKNSHILEEMAAELNSQGFTTTAKDIKVKLQNLTSKYRAESAKMGPSGSSPSSWPLYQKVHQVIGAFEINNVAELTEKKFLKEDEDNCNSDVDSTISCSPALIEQLLITPMALPNPPLASASSEKNKKNTFQQMLSKMLEKIEVQIHEQTEQLKRSDDRMHQLETERNKLLKQLVETTSKMQCAFIEYLKRN